jgi:hypothetical protein
MVGAVVLLVLVAAIGVWNVMSTYGYAEMYADPLQSEFAALDWTWIVLTALVLVGLTALATRIAPRMRRPLVALVGGVLVIAYAVAVPVTNHLGFEAKVRYVSEQPVPECGLGGATVAEFAKIDHPGSFGGGGSDQSGCSYMLRVQDVAQALDVYETGLRGLGYNVVRTGESLTATREDFTFSVLRGSKGGPYVEGDDPHALTVSLHTSG